MTQNKKDLLMKDLTARLPYKVYVQIRDGYDYYTSAIENIDIDGFVVDFEGNQIKVECVKPYLFPMSSMTEEQRKYISDKWGIDEDFNFEINPDWGECLVLTLGDVLAFVKWLIENHFDVNGLIPMGLADDATNLNIY